LNLAITIYLLLDVQPPLQTNCPHNITRVITSPTVVINWTEPSVHDPMNTHLAISMNYPQDYWEFHWGRLYGTICGNQDSKWIDI
jgi:hypothetical protein